ncbi:MAG: NAD(P)-dependent glycerol-3-phosphate dehydrogenase [Bdellovibrionales bacterium]|nr:NAD(P)-dependent glycerol-3-phosphate dehydrogenase [Bdellovibrionales bacterium]
MKKGFWSSSRVAVLGGGSFGTVIANMVAKNVAQVSLYVRAEEQARQMNSTRMNPSYVKEMVLDEKIRAASTYDKVFESDLDMVIFALPSHATRAQAKIVARYMKGHELVLHATKGIEEQSLKRISIVLAEELPVIRIGAISGPNLAGEIAKNEPAATVVASPFHDVIIAGEEILSNPRFRVYTSHDLIGVEWGGTLKNIFAIASGILDSIGFGWNTKSLLLSRGLAEMVRFGVAMGADAETFLGLSGMGDLIATCSSNQSRNFRVGYALAKGDKLDEVLADLGQVAEGVRTTRIVYEFAKERSVEMPITEAVYNILQGKWTVEQGVAHLMTRPTVQDE